jgi:lysozyme
MKLKELIKKNEGLRLKPYKCSAGKLTIGYGRNLDDRGISEREAEIMLEADISLAKQDLYAVFGDLVPSLTENRYNALVDMMFNLGSAKFRGFKKMIQAIKDNDWKRASMEMLDSGYAKQVPNRAQKNATYLRKG